MKDKKIQFSTSVNKSITKAFKAKCKAEQRCYSKVIEMLMKAWVEKNER